MHVYQSAVMMQKRCVILQTYSSIGKIAQSLITKSDVFLFPLLMISISERMDVTL